MQEDAQVTWLTVGEVARHAGLSVRTLHHYDQVGLLKPGGRSAAGYRLYSPADLHRLLQIQHLKSLGLSLDEVGTALGAEDFDALGVLEDHIAEVERRIEAEQKLLMTLQTLRTPAVAGWRQVVSAVEQSERLRHPEPHVRLRAALTAGDAVPLEALVEQLSADPVPGVREVLTWAIAQHGTKAVAHLVPLLGHAEPGVRAQAAHALSKVGDKRLVPAVIPLLRDEDQTVAAKAAQVLGRLGGDEALGALVDRVGAGPHEVDDAVVSALEAMGAAAVAPLLRSLTSSSPRVRAGAVEVVGLSGQASTAAAIAALLEDNEASVRFEAVVALGHLEGEQATRALSQARESPDERVAQIASRLFRNRRAIADKG
ncbi:MAG: HEAT repeat domain-containing protein [Arachnia sp.]